MPAAPSGSGRGAGERFDRITTPPNESHAKPRFGSPMRLSILAFAVFASCASLPPQSPRPVSAQERAQALSEVIDVRFGSLGKTPAVDACSVYRFVDADTAVLGRLGA